MLHALAVEDDDRLADDLVAALRGLAWVQRVASADEALAVLAWLVPDVVLLDLCGTSSEAPLLVATSVRMALDRAGDRLKHGGCLMVVRGEDEHGLVLVLGAELLESVELGRVQMEHAAILVIDEATCHLQELATEGRRTEGNHITLLPLKQ